MESIRPICLKAGVLGTLMALPSSVFLSVREDGWAELSQVVCPKASWKEKLGFSCLVLFGFLLSDQFQTSLERPVLLLCFGLFCGLFWWVRRKMADRKLGSRHVLFGPTELHLREVMHSGREVVVVVRKMHIQRLFQMEGADKTLGVYLRCFQSPVDYLVFSGRNPEVLGWLGGVLDKWSGVPFRCEGVV